MALYFQTLPINFSFMIGLNLILSIVVIFLERKGSTSTLAWLFFLNLVPVVGFLFYILLSQNIAKRRVFTYSKEEERFFGKLLLKQRRQIQQDQFEYPNHEITHFKDLILFHNHMSDALLSCNNDVTIFNNGVEKFTSLFNDLKVAKDHIHLDYYILKNDHLGNTLLDLLVKKASEGVEVRLLVDSLGGRTLSPRLLRKIRSSGIKIAFFFPSHFTFVNLKINFRNHRKLVIIDGKIGYIGGINIGDEYVNRNKHMGYWRDTHLRLIGDSVLSLQIRFILDWRNASKEPFFEVENYFRRYDSNGKTPLQIVSSGPDNINQQIKQGYLQMIHRAKKYIYIQTPYFIPDESIIEGLKIAAASGVDVRLMIPNKPDHPFVYWATYSYCGELLPYGVKVYTYERGFLHSKTIVSDDMIASVGSCNFDIRSFKLNFEANAFIYERRTAIKLRHLFEEDLTFSERLTSEKYSKRSLLVHIKEPICRLFSPVL